VDAHRLAELRSIALHRAVSERVRRDASLLDAARMRVARLRDAGTLHPEYAAAWERALSLPLDELCALLVLDTEQARALRQCTPFAGVIDARDRWRIWRETRDAHSEAT
jgi:hypothetical protein